MVEERGIKTDGKEEIRVYFLSKSKRLKEGAR